MSGRRKPAARKPAAKKRSLAVAKRPYYAGTGDYYKRARPRVRGRGAYKKDYGERLGSVVGEGLQELLAHFNPLKLLGFGDYAPAPFAKDIKENVLSMGNDPPEIINGPEGDVVIRHREFLGDITTGAAGVFTTRGYSINPGVPETFPWLSQIAHAFEQYRIEGMIFEFKSTSADALSSTNTALGTVIMATQYDATRPDFASKQQMENHQYAASARQSSSMLHPIECARSQSVLDDLYIRSGGLDLNEDLRFTDFGKFQIATTGQQGNGVNIGELWVSYQIRLLKPQFATAEGPHVYSTHIRGTGSISASNQYFGTVQAYTGNGGVTAALTTVQFPDWIDSGRYLLVYTVSGTNTATIFPTVTATSGCTLVTFWLNNTFSAVSTGTATITIIFYAAVIDINAPSALLTWSGGTLPSSATSVDLVVTSINPLASVDLPTPKEETSPKIEEIEAKSETSVGDLMTKLQDLGLTMDADRLKEYRLITELLSRGYK